MEEHQQLLSALSENTFPSQIGGTKYIMKLCSKAFKKHGLIERVHPSNFKRRRTFHSEKSPFQNTIV